MLSQLVAHGLPLVPTPVMRRLSSRYIAGETLDSALEVLERLRDEGHPGILDVLGEAVTNEAHARRVADEYCAAAEAIAARGLDVYVSIKPTHVGLGTSEDLCFELYSEVGRRCAELGVFFRVEMEDHTTTDGTLRVFERLRAEFENVGCVLQSRLFRTGDDIGALRDGPLDVRLVKGIYLEPEEIAHTRPDPIRAAFLADARRLLGRGARVRFATHDAALAEDVVRLVREHDVAPGDYEFQVLLGVQRPLWERWRAEGHTVRVYVPFGPEWRAYSLRRLKHNPELMKHLMLNLFRR